MVCGDLAPSYSRTLVGLSKAWATSRWSTSAAGDAHVPRDRGPRVARCGSDGALGLPASSWSRAPVTARLPPLRRQVAQLDLLVMAEAAIDRARRRHPDAVAAVAEIVRQRGDEAEPDAELLRPRNSAPARRCARATESAGTLLEPRARTAQRQIMLGAVLLDVAERHRLDERQVDAPRSRTSAASARSRPR